MHQELSQREREEGSTVCTETLPPLCAWSLCLLLLQCTFPFLVYGLVAFKWQNIVCRLRPLCDHYSCWPFMATSGHHSARSPLTSISRSRQQHLSRVRFQVHCLLLLKRPTTDCFFSGGHSGEQVHHLDIEPFFQCLSVQKAKTRYLSVCSLQLAPSV